MQSVNNHIGRQFWEFDPHLGTKEERAQVEQVHKEFNKNRFKYKHSSDLLMRLQVLFIYVFVLMLCMYVAAYLYKQNYK